MFLARMRNNPVMAGLQPKSVAVSPAIDGKAARHKPAVDLFAIECSGAEVNPQQPIADLVHL